MGIVFGSWTITEPFPQRIGYSQSSLAIHNRDANNVFVKYDTSPSPVVRKSSDGAASWDSPVTFWDWNNGSYNQAIWSDSSRVYCVSIKYTDPYPSEPSGYLNELMLSVSTDGGSTFTDKVIYAEGLWMNSTMEVYVSGPTRTIYVLFLTEGETWYGAKLKLAISTNDGDSWTIKDVGPHYDEALNTETSIDLCIVDSSTYYAITYRQYDYAKLICYRTTNGGDSWSLSVISNTANDAYGYLHNCMDFRSSSELYAAWPGYTAVKGIIFAKSTTSGVSWSTTSLFSGNWVDALSIKYYNGIIFIAYVDATADDLILAYSEDYGTSWTTITVDQTESIAAYCSLSIASNTIYIFYTDSNYYGKIAKCTISVSSYPPADPIDDNPDTLPDPGGDPQTLTFRWETYKAIRSGRELRGK